MRWKINEMDKIDKLIKRSLDHDLRYEYQGSFKTGKELETLLTKTCPNITQVIHALKKSEYYECEFKIINDKLYKILSDEDIKQMINEFIYDSNKCNFLLTISNSDINSTIDLHTGTIGEFNTKTQTYTAKHELNKAYINLLQDIADIAWFENDVESKDNIKRL